MTPGKNPHPAGTLAFAAWVFARLGGWTGYYGKPGPIVMLRGLNKFHAIKHDWTSEMYESRSLVGEMSGRTERGAKERGATRAFTPDGARRQAVDLILLFRPDLKRSRANAALADAARIIAGALYSDGRIDAAAEAARATADRIVLQFPVRWYSTRL